LSGDAEPLRGKQAFAELVPQSLAFPRPLRFDFAHRCGSLRRGFRVEQHERGRESWNPAEVVPGASE
jgi:hypothetical protein